MKTTNLHVVLAPAKTNFLHLFCVALDNFLNLTIRPNVISVAYSAFVLKLYMAFCPYADLLRKTECT
jgi:hypothetical protein